MVTTIIKKDAQRQFWLRLENVMREKGMVPADLAEKLETSRATVSEWKVRGSWPTGYDIIMICKALDVNAHWLLTGEGDAETPGADSKTATDSMLVARGVSLALAEMELSMQHVRDKYHTRSVAAHT